MCRTLWWPSSIMTSYLKSALMALMNASPGCVVGFFFTFPWPAGRAGKDRRQRNHVFLLRTGSPLLRTRLTVTFAHSTHTYAYALLRSFLYGFSSCQSHQRREPMRPLTHSHTQTDRSQRLGQYTHQTSSEATAKTVFSLSGDDRNTGTRQTPKFSWRFPIVVS